MSLMCRYTALYSRQNILLLLCSVGQKLFYSLPITRAYRHGFVKKALSLLRLSAAQVAFPTFEPHNLAAPRNMKAFLRPFMSLKFWHLGFLYYFLYFSLMSRRQDNGHSLPFQYWLPLNRSHLF